MIVVYQIRVKPECQSTISIILVVENGRTIFECNLLELPDKYNATSISRIPKGIYTLKKRLAGENGSRFNYNHFELLNVPNRSHIKWHVANYVHELKGCGALGLDIADIDKDGIIDVTSSTKALKKVYSILPDKTQLIIFE